MSDEVSRPAGDGGPGAPWSPPLKGSGHDLEQVRGALAAWLAERLGAADLRLGPLSVPKANGVSNETMVAEAGWSGGAVELVVRLQTDDPLYFENGVERQYDVYCAVAGSPGVLAPGLMGLERDAAVLGTPFYVMHRVPGAVPNDNPHYSVSGWVHDATTAQRERLWLSAVAQLVAVHQVPVTAVAFLDRPERGPNGLAQDLAYWRAAYRWAAQGVAYDVMDAAEAWLVSSLPADVHSGLSWGDARIENMLFQDFEVTAILDPESASLAGPGADLAWWALMDRGRPLPGIGSPRQTVALWEELSGRRLEHLHYYLVLCAFRLSAVYIRLADQLQRRGQLAPERRDLASRSEKMQQLALLLDLHMDGPLTARLPDVL